MAYAKLTKFQMNTTRLANAPAAAFKKSVEIAKVDAEARLHNKSKSGVKTRYEGPTVAKLIPIGLAWVFEIGRKPDYPVYPSGAVGIRRSRAKGGSERIGLGRKSLRESSGRSGTGAVALLISSGSLGGQFFSHVEGGDMDADPALHPAAADWANGAYQQTARASMAAQGLRPRR